MERYARMKTTMGRRYRVRMSEEERAARWLYNFTIVVLPFVSAAGMFLLWVKMG